ncbi:MAG: aldehyde dehydrogenase family protein [bacterium]|nr:aldehyde dehydrogenase family protein [bacterium]
MSAPAIATGPHTEIDSIPQCVARLRRAFDSGRTRPLAWREAQLKALIALCKEHKQEFLEALRADFGKPPFEALLADVSQGAIEARSALKNLKKWTRPQRVGTLPLIGKARILRDPLGVVLIISPWNYPVGLLFAPLVGAIAAGNAVVLKPSEVTPNVSALLAKLVPRYFDEEAITLVEGGVAETTAVLEQRFDHILYTGNGRVARVILEAAAKNLTPVTLELGGKSPCIVAEDANIEIAATRIAWGKFINSGQTCIAPDYVLVHENREQELVDALGAAIERFYGSSPQDSPDYARIVNHRHHERVATLIKDGTPAFGGETDAEDKFIAPTVLRGVSSDSRIMREEIFGPVLPVLTVKSVDEAIDFVNEREKPLALYVFSESSAVEDKVLAETSSGGATVNGTIVHLMDPRLPFGGVGSSGTGAYHGKWSFETFSHRKSVMSRGTRFDLSVMYPPYKGFFRRLLQRSM